MALIRLREEPTFWLALGGIVLSSWWARRRPGDHRRIAAILGLLGLVELGAYGHSLIVTTPVARFLGTDPIGDAIQRDRPNGQGSFLIRAVDSLYDDLRAGRRGFRKTNIYDSFQLQHAAELYETLYRTFGPDHFDLGRPMDAAVSDFRRDVRQAVLDRMGVAYLISNRDSGHDPRWLRIASGRWDGSSYAVFRNPTALPRAYVVPRAEITRDDARMVQQLPAFDPRESVLLTSDPLAVSPDRQPFLPIEWRRADPDHLILEVSTRAPGLLVISDNWMPGWGARVDGHPVKILRGNRAQRVIPIETPGKHRIAMIFVAPGLITGKVLTLLSSSIWTMILLKKTKNTEMKY